MPKPEEETKKQKPAAKKASTSAVKKSAPKKKPTTKKKSVKRISSKKTANRTPRKPKNPDEKVVGRGRPLKFKTVKELKEAIEAYFNSLYEPLRDKDGLRVYDGQQLVMVQTRVATVTALAVALDTTRETLMDYEKGKHDDKGHELTADEKAENEQIECFSDTIKKAKLRIQADTEQALYSRNSVTGAIFSLKNNYGWVDKQEIETKDLTPPPPLSPRKAKEASDGE